ncbi:Hypothetical predicted protein [Octopus vulgaris]|uniref:Uncharacterized protein n=1 Tax=Octopus vulgaris TaxID=6645 RepID=A0AA36F9P3_OCTVU|nr:Hypothetical predicted protein [Octopus vulgaris]
MHKLLYSDELGNAACNCLSFIRFSGSKFVPSFTFKSLLFMTHTGSGWQKIFVFNKTSVDKSPIYKDWEILPIDKVKVIMRKDNMDVKSLTFDGRGTNYTSWFNESNLIEEPWFGNLTRGSYSRKF